MTSRQRVRSATLVVSEIFGPTLQGEGALAGRPTVFVRTGGCDYRCRWCISPDARLLTGDMNWVPARDIQPGTEILGTSRRDMAAPRRPDRPYGIEAIGGYRSGTVTDKRFRVALRVRIHFQDAASVEVSADHRFTRFKTSRFVAARELTPGDRVRCVGTWEPARGGDYLLGYLAGAADGDGSFHDKPNGARHFTLASSDEELIQAVAERLRHFGLHPTLGHHASGGDSAPTRQIPIVRICRREEIAWLEPALHEDGASRAWHLGYFAGLFDTDGSSDGKTIRIAQSKLAVRDRAKRAFSRLGLEVTEEPDRLRLASPRHRIRPLLGEAHPVLRRKWDPIIQGRGGHTEFATVAHVEPLGEGEVVSLATDLGTYIAEGFLSRNCDTPFAVLPENRDDWETWETSEVLDEVDRLAGGPILVSLSGGNPALQDLGPLIRGGRDRGHTFALETQGSVAQAWFAELDHLTLSPKGPSSGHLTGLAELAACLDAAEGGPETVFKVVVFDDRDYDYARSLAANFGEYPYFLQVGNPEPDGEPDPADLMARFRWLGQRVLEDCWYGVRVLPQLHVLAWGNQRGV